jgi:HK97 family phage prohead protease
VSTEKRTLANRHAVEIRQEEDGTRYLVGYGAVFWDREDRAGTQYALYPGMVERIMPGAFDEAIGNKDDARGLFNHDSSAVLGRTASGTMVLSVDSVGLRYEIELADKQLTRDLVTDIERGDITGSSFAFNIRAGGVKWVEEEQEDGMVLDVREIHSVRLFDTGPVTYPAYTGTSVGTRDQKNLEDERALYIKERDPDRRSIELERMDCDIKIAQARLQS